MCITLVSFSTIYMMHETMKTKFNKQSTVAHQGAGFELEARKGY